MDEISLLASVLNGVVVDYLTEQMFHTEPQPVVQFPLRVRYDLVGDDTLLLVGLNANGERVVRSYNLLGAKAKMISELREDETLLAFGAYPDPDSDHDHVVYIYVEKGKDPCGK